MKKKIFILTGESSGDKLASNVIPYLNNKSYYITAIGSDHIKKRGIKLLFNSKEISVMGFVDVFKKLFFLKNKINKKNPSGVLIKVPKKIQDLRVDLPTIGYETIRNCIKIGLRGIALKKNQNIFLDQKKSLNLIKKHSFFITVINWKKKYLY